MWFRRSTPRLQDNTFHCSTPDLGRNMYLVDRSTSDSHYRYPRRSKTCNTCSPDIQHRASSRQSTRNYRRPSTCNRHSRAEGKLLLKPPMPAMP
jgi:hypothetical protein